VHLLATRLLKNAEDAGCSATDCKLLVTNFVLPDGNSSLYGRQLADELSVEIVRQQPAIKIVDRSLLQTWLAKERYPSTLINEATLRAIGEDLNANVVLIGQTDRIDENVIQLSARMLNVSDEKRIGPSAEVILPADSDLSPSEPYPFTLAGDSTLVQEQVYRVGVDGVSSPTCSYMPNPSYSERARKYKVNGTLEAEAIVNSDGKLENVRIVRGFPYGLNENTIATMRTWRCNPAHKDGKPVPVVVQFEVNFRVY
jgi:TonB family protein